MKIRIVLSGGVMRRRSLFPKIRTNVVRLLNGYISAGCLLPGPEGIDLYIVPSQWGDDAGAVVSRV